MDGAFISSVLDLMAREKICVIFFWVLAGISNGGMVYCTDTLL